jgi:hypothetical protein
MAVLSYENSMNSKAPKTFRGIIELWGSPDRLSDELGAPLYAARKWYTKDRIPSSWWFHVIRHKRARDAGVTADLLIKLDAR